jgi:hypothetical protein
MLIQTLNRGAISKACVEEQSPRQFGCKIAEGAGGGRSGDFLSWWRKEEEGEEAGCGASNGFLETGRRRRMAMLSV